MAAGALDRDCIVNYMLFKFGNETIAVTKQIALTDRDTLIVNYRVIAANTGRPK